MSDPELDDELSPAEIEALMEINQKLIEVNERLKQMDMSLQNQIATISRVNENRERRLSDLERSLGYTWSPHRMPIVFSSSMDPVQTVISPPEPSIEDEMNVDESVCVLSAEEVTKEIPEVEFSTLSKSNCGTPWQSNSGLIPEVILNDYLTLDIVSEGCLKSDFMASSMVVNRTSDLCTLNVCENAGMSFLIPLDTPLSYITQHDCLVVVEDVYVEELGSRSPPPVPPDIDAFLVNGDEYDSIPFGYLLPCVEGKFICAKWVPVVAVLDSSFTKLQPWKYWDGELKHPVTICISDIIRICCKVFDPGIQKVWSMCHLFQGQSAATYIATQVDVPSDGGHVHCLLLMSEGATPCFLFGWFSSPRPPKGADLEDKVSFMGGGMLQK